MSAGCFVFVIGGERVELIVYMYLGLDNSISVWIEYWNIRTIGRVKVDGRYGVEFS